MTEQPIGCLFAGLVLDSSNNVVARRLQISDTDYEAVRIRYNSTDNTIRVSSGSMPAPLQNLFLCANCTLGQAAR